MSKNLAVMGTGYVGLVLSFCMAESGHEVTAIDIDEDRIDRLRSGELPIYEPGIEDIQEKHSVMERLTFTSDWEENLPGRDLIFIAVGTPKKEDGSADLSYVMSAAEMIGQNIQQDSIVVTKSTVPVGTGMLIQSQVNEELEKRFDTSEQPSVSVASNPEFLREGSAVEDFKNPDRVIVGSEEEKTRKEVAELYESFNAPVIETDLRTAEMIKYAANAMLATKISFINEIANVCEVVGANVTQVAEAVGLDHRINRDFLNAGIGYGGSCFPKDTEALVQVAGQGGYHSQILSAVMAVNQQQRNRFARKILRRLPRDASSLGVLGLSFKPNTDDMREAPSIDIIQELQSEKLSIKAYDPKAMDNARERLSGVELSNDPYKALEGTDAMILFTEWQEFLELDFERVKDLLNYPIIFDGRNVLPMEKLVDLGFDYYGVGRGIDRLDDVLSQEKLIERSS